MYNKPNTLNKIVQDIKNLLGSENELIIRNIIVGKKSNIEAAVIYMNGLVNKDMIDRDILKPLMLNIGEDLSIINDLDKYLCMKYIAVSNTTMEKEVSKAADSIKRGKTLIVLNGWDNLIIVDTTGPAYRSISEPVNDVSLRGPREGFIENLETNVSILKRKIKDKNLKTEKFTLGTRTQSDLVIMYIDDIVDKEFLQMIKDKINNVDMKVDSVPANSFIEQFSEDHPYSVFPQVIGSERPDIIQAALMDGRIAFFLEGTPYVTIYPTIFFDFFQTVEDYYGRTVIATFTRILRIIATFFVITLPSIYITFIKYNAELIPIQYVVGLIQARQNIALSPFMSLFAMQLTIEFLREGGNRLPSKIGQTLSVVGGIIIGDAALQARIVSSSTLFVAGITTVASFVIPNYQMSISIRLISYPMLVLANWLGILGICIGWFFIISYLCSMENFGVPYFSFHKSDMKDIFVRAPIYEMNKRPEVIPNNDDIRQDNLGGENE